MESKKVVIIQVKSCKWTSEKIKLPPLAHLQQYIKHILRLFIFCFKIKVNLYKCNFDGVKEIISVTQ